MAYLQEGIILCIFSTLQVHINIFGLCSHV